MAVLAGRGACQSLTSPRAACPHGAWLFSGSGSSARFTSGFSVMASETPPKIELLANRVATRDGRRNFCFRTRITACYAYRVEAGPDFAPGLPHVTRIELRQALILYEGREGAPKAPCAAATADAVLLRVVGLRECVVLGGFQALLLLS